TLNVYDVAHGQDTRTLNPCMLGNRTETTTNDWVHAARFSPDGRLAALAAREGVRLDDAFDGRELAWLKTGVCETILFDRDGRSLITYGVRGLFRWPIRHDADGREDALRIGPPELLQDATPADVFRKASWLPDHRTLAVINNRNARVLLVDTTSPRPASI